MKLLKRIIGTRPSKNDVNTLVLSTQMLNKRFRAVELIHYSNVAFLLNIIYTKSLGDNDAESKYQKLLQGDINLPLELIDCKIDFARVDKIIRGYGLSSVNTFYKEGLGTITSNEEIRAFGNKDYAVICETEKDIIKHIWFTGKSSSDKHKTILERISVTIGVELDLVAIQWLPRRYFFLFSPDDAKDFVRHSF